MKDREGPEERELGDEQIEAKIGGKLDKIIEAQAAERLADERRFGSIGERFGLIGERLASIEAKLEAKASAAELAEIKGRVTSLPSTWQMAVLIIATVFMILGGSFLILKFGLPHVP